MDSSVSQIIYGIESHLRASNILTLDVIAIFTERDYLIVVGSELYVIVLRAPMRF